MNKFTLIFVSFALLGTALSLPHKLVAAHADSSAPYYSEKYLASLPKSPICWRNVTRCEQHSHCVSSGNSRCSKCFGFVEGRPMSGLCGTAPELMSYEETAAPEQIRIATGKDSSWMSVTWITNIPAPSLVFYTNDAKSDFNSWTKVDGTTTNYTSHCGGDQSPHYIYYSGFIHKAAITGLSPSTTYYYRVGSDSVSAGLSELRSFTTLPAPGDFSQPLKLAVIGDLGQTAYSAQTMIHIQDDDEIQAILHAGDMSYADCDHKRWDSWGLMVDQIASTLPYMVTTGNHEIEADTVQLETFSAYKHRFYMPEVKPTEDNTTPEQIPHDWCAPSDYTGGYDYGNSFYSFETSGAHVIMLNSYTGTDPSSNQYKWLVEDFKSIDRKRTPWVIVLMHGPWYNTNRAHHNEKMTLAMVKNMEQLFFDNRVNAVFSGHVHAYERTFEVFQNQTYAPGGAPLYVVIGDGGNREGHASTYYQQADWSAFRNGNQFGHGKLTLVNETVAEFKWMRNVDPEKVEADSIFIHNNESKWGQQMQRERIWGGL